MESLDCTFVVTEFCPEGDLFSNITERGKYVGDDALAKRAFLQILDAVEFCHYIGICHKDLKPEHVLVTGQGMTIKITNFGLATTDHLTSDSECGSTFYIPSAQKCMWSLGAILLSLTCGRNLWKRASFEDSVFRAYMKDPKLLRPTLPISPELDSILGRIFSLAKGITIPELRRLILGCRRFTSP
ncbi:hypothetical protein GP486_008532, partial [Trichoglossum hirsutum]